MRRKILLFIILVNVVAGCVASHEREILNERKQELKAEAETLMAICRQDGFVVWKNRQPVRYPQDFKCMTTDEFKKQIEMMQIMQ